MSKMSKKELKDLFNLMEEFSWIISKYKTIDFKQIQSNLISLVQEEEKSSLTNFQRYRDQDANKNYLIGVLPKFFQDKELFEKNSDLSDFAECLDIHLRNPEKKSRYEIIGTILCVLSEMDEKYLEKFVRAIELMLVNENLLNNIKHMKSIRSETYSWNEVIKALSGNTM